VALGSTPLITATIQLEPGSETLGRTVKRRVAGVLSSWGSTTTSATSCSSFLRVRVS
jgi:hypothetical protein